MLRILPSGPKAFLVEVEDDSQVMALLNEVANRNDTGWIAQVVDIVPGERTVLFDGVTDLHTAKADVCSWQLQAGEVRPTTTVEIECRYDGPDLDRVGELWEMSNEDVVYYHSRLPHRVAFCGFAPGFAYIQSLDQDHLVPRRASPRGNVGAGSVGLARSYTGIYPRSSPGGWQLIGRSDTSIWDENREPPALLTPGTRVIFVPI
ncbi:MAG: allophanate hydrolase subunit 1 [Ferrimicrobium sp.]|jgi:KipI family sensor histidine kinase inhibitor|nr:allophanate hydrolase subunit 1 [Ferrimicrobium sp.]